ncbi:MAG: hypothetical protein ACRDQ9_07605 [Pseudonocardiaceae bacterium]
MSGQHALRRRAAGLAAPCPAGATNINGVSHDRAVNIGYYSPENFCTVQAGAADSTDTTR